MELWLVGWAVDVWDFRGGKGAGDRTHRRMCLLMIVANRGHSVVRDIWRRDRFGPVQRGIR